MKKTLLLAIAVVLTVVAPVTAEMVGGTGELYVPNSKGQEKVVPVIVDNFITGTTRFGQSAYSTLDALKNKCSADNATCVVQGTVSDLHISQNGCYVDPGDPAYFSLRQGPKHLVGKNAKETDRMCNGELATARAWTVRNWLVQNGVPKSRVIIYDFPVEAKRSNDPLANQSVAILVVYNENSGNCPGKNCPVPRLEVTMPDNCQYTTSQEEVNGTLVIKVNMTCDEKPSQENQRQETRTQSTVDPEEEDGKCHWYNRWPCMTKAQKAAVIGTGAAVVIGGVILSQTCIEIDGGEGGGNGGDGGTIKIGGKCGEN